MLSVLSGCHFLPLKGRPEPIPVPDPPRPVAPKPASPPAKPATSELTPPPQIPTVAPEVKPEVTQVIAEQPVPPKPKPSKKKIVTKKLPPPPVVAAPSTPEPSPDAVPKLGEIISDDQKAGYLKACDQALSRARKALGQLKGFTLTNEQTETVERIRTFISQAEQARQNDPQTARQLADRADLLSRDLVRSLR